MPLPRRDVRDGKQYIRIGPGVGGHHAGRYHTAGREVVGGVSEALKHCVARPPVCRGVAGDEVRDRAGVPEANVVRPQLAGLDVFVTRVRPPYMERVIKRTGAVCLESDLVVLRLKRERGLVLGKGVIRPPQLREPTGAQEPGERIWRRRGALDLLARLPVAQLAFEPVPPGNGPKQAGGGGGAL